MDPIEALLAINVAMLVITIAYDVGRLYYERCKVKKMDKVPMAVARKRKEK